MDTDGIAALRRAKELLGSEAVIAELVGVKQPSVNYILNAGKKVPAEWCLAIERATAEKCAELGEGEPVTRHDLRPDLYPRAEAAA